ncbi:Prenylcysteine lyase-domain-containing protein [Pterulicium gracile]|uniref:Prenylcysteine lyase-domain-containing protein n=1 Tax=Pterulicium gracile TaxID=1884261 RepID=A0A5C3QNT6_9AGAR|nr:Prenylcysteine lyase-domain-containing protein [Pterula gracilis]
MLASHLLVVLPLLLHTHAFQFPFRIPFLTTQPKPSSEPVPHPPPRVAIIGAGPSGSSAAFWLSLAKQRYGLDDLEIDVFEKSSYIGGRSTVAYPYDNHDLPAVELGASVFVGSNKNLWRAADEFNLTRIPFKSKAAEGFGMWDGSNVIFAVTSSWWDYPKMIWRYGFKAPKRTDTLVKTMIERYLSLYSPHPPRWDNITSLASTLQWNDLITQSTADWLQSQGVSKQFIYELVEVAVRVNYGQDVEHIHALEGLVSLAANNVVSIKGGNFQVFENFLQRSGANVRLNTNVLSISANPSLPNYWDVRHQTNGGRTEVGTYKGVIVAFPMPRGPGDFIHPPPELHFPQRDYVKLHVTLLATTCVSPNVTFLARNSGKEVASLEGQKLPRTLYASTLGLTADEVEFNAISYLTELDRGEDAPAEQEWIVKVFSLREVSDEWLRSALGDTIGWVSRKEWDAYPLGTPSDEFAPVRVDKGLFYVNSFENFISTMETSTVASRNVVDLLLNEEFNGAGVCRRSLSADDRAAQTSFKGPKGFVFGWDC